MLIGKPFIILASYGNVKENFIYYEIGILAQIKVSKHDYFNCIFTASKTDIKKNSRSLNKILSRNKKICDLPPNFYHNGRTLSNTNEKIV